MNVGKSYRLPEFLLWTRRRLYAVVLLSVIPVLLYETFGLRWIAIPWTAVALLGTAASFIAGFKNTQTYNRTVEAQQVWSGIATTSRAWALFSRDYLKRADETAGLFRRHMAWLTALRYQLRQPREWESAATASNREYLAAHRVPERELPLVEALKPWCEPDELRDVLAARNKAAFLLSRQGRRLRELFDGNEYVILQFADLEKMLKEMLDHQGRAERIKNFPYPRQYEVINRIFIWAFCALLPLGMLREFDRLNDAAAGFMAGHMVWLAVPFSALVGWMYSSLEQVGESTENPFEGSANDVPITQVCRLIERDMREMLGETALPALPRADRNIIL